MFIWIRKKRILKLVDKAQDYVQQHYIEEKKSDTRFSRSTSQGWQERQSGQTTSDDSSNAGESLQTKEHDVRYSREPVIQDGIKFSLRDNYDDVSIQRTMRSMSPTTPTERVLHALESSTNMTFVDKLLEHIDKRHMRDSDVYHAAQIDRRLFSKIISDREYKPAKDTCIAFAFALKLTLDDAEDLLSRAGYTLSHSNKRDVLLEYFFKEEVYNLFDINDILNRLDQKIIGRF